ncbi:hypothetical protein ES703_103454 [subsurface metagenome]
MFIIYEISYIINNSDTKWLLVESRFREATEKIWERADELGFAKVKRILIADEPVDGWTYYDDIVEIGQRKYPSIKTTPKDTGIPFSSNNLMQSDPMHSFPIEPNLFIWSSGLRREIQYL